MKTLLNALAVVFVVFISESFAQLTTVWQKSNSTGNIPSWFGSHTERGLAYGNVSGKDRLYVVSRKGVTNVFILNAAKGDSIGTLTTTGVSGGTFALNDVEVSSDGIIFAANLTVNAKTSAFKVYKWTGESAVPAAVISFADSTYRLGDHITVSGSTADNSATILAPAAGKKAIVKFTTTDNGNTFSAKVITLNDTLSIGTTPKAYPAGTNFFVSSAGIGIREYDASGKLLGSVGALPTTIGSMAYLAFGTPMKTYVLAYDYSGTTIANPPQFVRVVDITNGIGAADSVNVTPVLGTTTNTNGTGDIALKDNSDGTYTVYVLATNNGLGAYALTPITSIIEEKTNQLPTEFTLSQNYPNPFNPTTNISYSILKSGYVSLKIYNIVGQEVATLYQGYQNAGSYKANFDGSRLSSGVYLYQLRTNQFSETKKMILMK